MSLTNLPGRRAQGLCTEQGLGRGWVGGTEWEVGASVEGGLRLRPGWNFPSLPCLFLIVISYISIMVLTLHPGHSRRMLFASASAVN